MIKFNRRFFSILKKFSNELEPNYQMAGYCKPYLFKIVGHKNNNKLSPIISYDHMYDKLPNGYPDHPHRGFQTVSYYVSGSNLHEDDLGYKEVIESEDVHLQTMGKGCVHSEMPTSFENLTIGFQLWVDLPKEKKLMDPNFINFKKEKIPEFKAEGIVARVLSGEVALQKQKFNGVAKLEAPEFFYLDIRMEANKNLSISLPSEVNGLVFTYEGDIYANGEIISKLKSRNFNFTDKATDIELVTKETSAKVVILGGKPLNQGVAYDNLHVLTSEEELKKTLEDVEKKVNGFDRVWTSETIKNLEKIRANQEKN